MVFDRGSKSDFDRWAELGNPGWDYDGLFPYFKKVGKPVLPDERRAEADNGKQQEIFTPPSDDIVAEWGVEFDPESHGESGNINVTYSPWFYPLTRMCPPPS